MAVVDNGVSARLARLLWSGSRGCCDSRRNNVSFLSERKRFSRRFLESIRVRAGQAGLVLTSPVGVPYIVFHGMLNLTTYIHVPTGMDLIPYGLSTEALLQIIAPGYQWVWLAPTY